MSSTGSYREKRRHKNTGKGCKWKATKPNSHQSVGERNKNRKHTVVILRKSLKMYKDIYKRNKCLFAILIIRLLNLLVCLLENTLYVICCLFGLYKTVDRLGIVTLWYTLSVSYLMLKR